MTLILQPALDETPCEELRVQRQRLVREVQRLAWLRRLVQARSDLEVARLTGLDELTAAADLAAGVHDALALGSARGPELLQSLADAVRELDTAGRRARADLEQITEELLDQLAQDPSRCLGVVERGAFTREVRERNSVSADDMRVSAHWTPNAAPR